jgi:Zn-dependent protease
MALREADIVAKLLAFAGKFTFLHDDSEGYVIRSCIVQIFTPEVNAAILDAMDVSSVIGFAVVLVCILVAMTVHEFMHAWVGYKLGDTTARDEGRISLNPLRHIDPFMTVLLPAFTWAFLHVLILAAKPVPFNPRRVKYDEFGAALIAAAGPLSNLALAILGSLIGHAFVADSLVGQILSLFVMLNVALFVFNMIPIPPLDGSRVLYAFAPRGVQEFMERIEPYGFYIVIALVMLGGLGGIVSNINHDILNLLP